MGVFIALPVDSLIVDTAVGYNTYSNAYGHCKVSYGSTSREFSFITENSDILFTIIDNADLYHQIYPTSIGSYLAIGGICFSKNASSFNTASYALRNGSPEVATTSWITHTIDNEMSNPINGKRYITSPAWIRTDNSYDYMYEYTGIYGDITHVNSLDELVSAINAYAIKSVDDIYPIIYHYTNSIVSGPTEATVGDTVIVSAIPDVGYGITDASTQILVTNNDIAVPYTWDATNQRITFTMPDPS